MHPVLSLLRSLRWLLLCSTNMVLAQQVPEDVVIELLPLRDDVYLLVGSGGNIVIQAGSDGVLLVDSQYAELSERILARIRTISSAPLRFLVNTHYHPDHTGGNARLRAAGATLLAHENVRLRMEAPAVGEPVPAEAWPMQTYSGQQHDLYLNGEGIRILHQGAAHTDGDSFIHFRRADVIATGDVYVTNMYPFIDSGAGGNFLGVVAAADALVEMMIPAQGQDGGTLVVPGHGRVSDLGDVLVWRDMLVVIRDRVQAMIDRGMSLDEVQAARPTQDYDPRWGRESGWWTTQQFVEAVYRDLHAASGRRP